MKVTRKAIKSLKVHIISSSDNYGQHCYLIHCSFIHCYLIYCYFINCSFIHCSFIHCSFIQCSFIHCSFSFLADDSDDGIGLCGWMLTAVSWAIVLVTLPFSLCVCFKVSPLHTQPNIFFFLSFLQFHGLSEIKETAKRADTSLFFVSFF